MKKKQKFYTKEFKIEAVKLAKELGSSKQAASSLGVSSSAMCKWVNQYQDLGQEAFPGKGKLAGSDEEIRQLKLQVKRLEMEKSILKKAITFFGDLS
jgi:transposase